MEEVAGVEVSQLSDAQPEARQFSRRTIVFTLIGTMLVTFIATLDQTIVGTALPRIVADLQGFDQIAWVTTVYLLTSTVTIPIYGKLSDLFGRKVIFLTCVIIFLVGSALSGLAQSMMQLVLFRAFQGIGAGGLIPVATATVGDLFSPRERAKWVGITSSSYALASIVGPLAGGLLTDAASWRWVFYINLPIGLLALLVLTFLMPPLRAPKKQVMVDYIGSILVVLTTVLILLDFSWAGDKFAWLSWQSLSLLGAALILLALLVNYSAHQERLGREPIVEPGMFKDVRVFSISLLASMLISVVLLGCIYFIPVFLQSVTGVSATNSGLALIPLMLSSILGAVIGGAIISATGRYKLNALISAALVIIGIVLLLRLDVHSTSWDVVIDLTILGVGNGSIMSLFTITVQNAMPNKMGQATSAVVFFRQLGQSIGLAAFGAVVTSSYVPGFYKALPIAIRQTVPTQLIKVFENPLVLTSPYIMAPIQASFERSGAQGHAAFNAILNAVKLALAESIHGAILLSLGLMIISFGVVCFLKEIPLRSREEKHDRKSAQEE